MKSSPYTLGKFWKRKPYAFAITASPNIEEFSQITIATQLCQKSNNFTNPEENRSSPELRSKIWKCLMKLRKNSTNCRTVITGSKWLPHRENSKKHEELRKPKATPEILHKMTLRCNNANCSPRHKLKLSNCSKHGEHWMLVAPSPSAKDRTSNAEGTVFFFLLLHQTLAP